MRRALFIACFCVVMSGCFYQQDLSFTGEAQSVMKVVTENYVEAVFVTRDSAAVRQGFHPDFLMHVYADGQLIQAPLGMWLQRLSLDGTQNENPVNAKIKSIDVMGSAAVVQLEIRENNITKYSDIIGLYKFPDGWKIVNKIFHEHS